MGKTKLAKCNCQKNWLFSGEITISSVRFWYSLLISIRFWKLLKLWNFPRIVNKLRSHLDNSKQCFTRDKHFIISLKKIGHGLSKTLPCVRYTISRISETKLSNVNTKPQSLTFDCFWSLHILYHVYISLPEDWLKVHT